MRTMRTLFNAVTLALLLFTLYLFFWLDNKSDVKFSNLMTEIKTSNESVNTQISEMKIELVKINHMTSAIKTDHDEKFKR